MRKFSTYLAILTSLVLPVLSYAQGSVNTPISANIQNPIKAGDDLMSVLTALLNNVVMPIAAVAVVVWIVWAGFSYVLAQGNEVKIQKAHQRLLWSLVGAGILLGAAGISLVVQKTIEALIK